jgi:hypothetical protein
MKAFHTGISFRTLLLGIIIFSSPSLPLIAALPADGLLLTSWHDGSPFLLPYTTQLANFDYCLGDFITQRHLKSGKELLKLQIYQEPSAQGAPTIKVYIGDVPQRHDITAVANYSLKCDRNTQCLTVTHQDFPLLSARPLSYAPSFVPHLTPHPALYPQPAVCPPPGYSHSLSFPLQHPAALTSTPSSLPPVLPLLPSLIAPLAPTDIVEGELSFEQMELIEKEGTLTQQLALAKRLENAKKNLGHPTTTIAPLSPTSAVQPSTAQLAAVQPPLVLTPSAPAPSVPSSASSKTSSDKVVPYTISFPPLSSSSQPRQTLPLPAPSLPLTPVAPSPRKEIPSASREAQPTPSRPSSSFVTSCNQADKERYKTISEELKKTPRNYSKCITLLSECDPRTSSYLSHLALCVNRLLDLNRFPTLAELTLLDTLVTQALPSAPSSYVSLRTYLDRRTHQKAKQQKEEEQARKTKEEETQRKEQQALQKQKKEEEDRQQRERDRLRREKERETREKEINEKLEAAVEKSQKKTTPTSSVPGPLRVSHTPPVSHNERHLIAKAQKAAAVQAEEQRYSSIKNHVEKKDYAPALTQLAACEKNSRRFVNFILDLLPTLEQEGTAADEINFRTLVITALSSSIERQKPLTSPEKITFYTYLARHSESEEDRTLYLDLAAQQGDTESQSNLAMASKLARRGNFPLPEQTDLSSVDVVVSSLSAGKTVHILQDENGNPVLITYNPPEGVLNIQATLETALLNLMQTLKQPLHDTTSLKSHLSTCRKYVETVSAPSDNDPEKCTLIQEGTEKLMRYFLAHVALTEHFLIENLEELFEKYGQLAVVLYQTALDTLEKTTQCRVARKLILFIPHYLRTSSLSPLCREALEKLHTTDLQRSQEEYASPAQATASSSLPFTAPTPGIALSLPSDSTNGVLTMTNAGPGERITPRLLSPDDSTYLPHTDSELSATLKECHAYHHRIATLLTSTTQNEVVKAQLTFLNQNLEAQRQLLRLLHYMARTAQPLDEKKKAIKSDLLAWCRKIHESLENYLTVITTTPTVDEMVVKQAMDNLNNSMTSCNTYFETINSVPRAPVISSSSASAESFQEVALLLSQPQPPGPDFTSLTKEEQAATLQKAIEGCTYYQGRIDKIIHGSAQENKVEDRVKSFLTLLHQLQGRFSALFTRLLPQLQKEHSPQQHTILLSFTAVLPFYFDLQKKLDTLLHLIATQAPSAQINTVVATLEEASKKCMDYMHASHTLTP